MEMRLQVRFLRTISACLLLLIASCRTITEYSLSAWTLQEYGDGTYFVLKQTAAPTVCNIRLEPSVEIPSRKESASFSVERDRDRLTISMPGRSEPCWSVHDTAAAVCISAAPGSIPLRISISFGKNCYPVGKANIAARTAGAPPPGAYTMLHDRKQGLTLVLGGDIIFRADPHAPGHLNGVLQPGKTFTAVREQGSRFFRPAAQKTALRCSGWLISTDDSLAFADELSLLSRYMSGSGLSALWCTARCDENGRMILPAAGKMGARVLAQHIKEQGLHPGVRLLIPSRRVAPDTAAARLTLLKKQGFERCAVSCRDSLARHVYLKAGRKVFGRNNCLSVGDVTIISADEMTAEGPRLYRADPDPVSLLDPGASAHESTTGWTLNALLNAVEFFGIPFWLDMPIQTLSYGNVERLWKLVPFRVSRPLSVPGKPRGTDTLIMSVYRPGHDGARWLEMDVYNPHLSHVTREVRFNSAWYPTVPLTVFDTQNGKILDTFNHRVMLDVPARDVCRILVTPAEIRPAFLFCTAPEFYIPGALHMCWNAEDSLFSGTLDLRTCKAPFSLYYRIPPAWPEPQLYSDAPLEYQKRTGPLLEIVFAEMPGGKQRIHVSLQFTKFAVSPPLPELSPI